MVNRERFQNSINSIRENLAFLLQKTTLASVLLLVAFSILLSGLFFLYGVRLSLIKIWVMWIGGLVSLVSINLAYPLGFSIVKNEVDMLSRPQDLFDIYFGVGLVIGLFLLLSPMIGLYSVIRLWGISYSVFYLLGIAVIAFMVRLGGGLFAKAADIASSFIHQQDQEIATNDLRNVASIADKIGDFFNNGLALSLDLIESMIGIMVAIGLYINTYYISSGLAEAHSQLLIRYPVLIILGSIGLSFLSGFVFLVIKRRTMADQILKPLHAIYLSLVLITIFSFVITRSFSLPLEQIIPFFSVPVQYTPFICIFLGVIFAVLIGIVTDYYTFDSHNPVRENVKLAEYGAVMPILNGLATGKKSLYIPIISASMMILVTYKLAHYYGILLLGTGLLSMSPMIIVASLCAPFFDNINGVLRMEEPESPQLADLEKLNSIGNSLSALAKIYASNAVLMVVFALFISFVKISGMKYYAIPIFHPVILTALFLGGLLPYLWSSTLIRALAFTITGMVDEGQLQIAEIPYLRQKKTGPDVRGFIKNSGLKIIRNMILPSLFVFFVPILIGKLFGLEILSTLFIGLLLTGLFMAISYSNTGAVLDNSKKLIEKGYFGGVNTPTYEHVVVGDLFGDALKDVVAPTLNHFIKVVIIISIIIVPILI